MPLLPSRFCLGITLSLTRNQERMYIKSGNAGRRQREIRCYGRATAAFSLASRSWGQQHPEV